MTHSVEQLQSIIQEAQSAAHAAANTFFQDTMGGEDRGSCGFAWVIIESFGGKVIKGNTKVGRSLKQAGVRQNWQRKFEIWNPACFPCQNVDTLERGASAAAEVFRSYGFDAYACSRLD